MTRVAARRRGSWLLCAAVGLAATTSLASPHVPTEGASVTLSGTWPLTARTTLGLGGELITPFLTGGWRVDGEQLDLGGGLRAPLLQLELFELSVAGGASGLIGVGTSNDLGARGFVEGTAHLHWRWFHLFGGPRISVATLLGKTPESRIAPVVSLGAGLNLNGVGMYLRTEGGYAFSRYLAGGLTGVVELAVVLPLVWPQVQ